MRVLDEACDPAVPLMERVKFFSIFSSNLDEFFMVRVGSLVDMAQLSPHERDNKTGMNAGEQLDLIYETIHRMMPAKYSRYEKLCRELDDWGISRISFAGLTNTDMIFVRNYFLQHILSAASSGILEDGSDTLEFKSKDLYVASRLEKNGHHSTGVIKLPDNIERFVRLPGEGIRYILTEDILCGMADGNPDAAGDQFISGDGRIHIRAGNHHAHTLQHQTQRPHGNAADTHQMHMTAGCEVLGYFFSLNHN